MRTGSRVFSLRRLPHRFAEDRRGTAAMEFCIVLPIMLALAYSTSEICNAVAIERKLTSTARAISDIAAQGTAISNDEMANILNAGKAMLKPYPESKLKLRVSAINIDAQNKATVAWSDAYPAADARAKNSAVTIPAALLNPNTQLIWGEVGYEYQPTPAAIKSLWSFQYENNQLFARPRGASGIVCRPTCS